MFPPCGHSVVSVRPTGIRASELGHIPGENTHTHTYTHCLRGWRRTHEIWKDVTNQPVKVRCFIWDKRDGPGATPPSAHDGHVCTYVCVCVGQSAPDSICGQYQLIGVNLCPRTLSHRRYEWMQREKRQTISLRILECWMAPSAFCHCLDCPLCTKLLNPWPA